MATKLIQEKFFRETPGKKINPDHFAGNQCVDVPDQYAQTIFGVPWQKSLGGVVGARDLMRVAPEEYWEKHWNDPKKPEQLPQRGDIVVFEGLGAGSANPFGHTGINLLADLMGMQLLQQDGFKPPLIFVDGGNYSDAPAEVTRLGYYNPGTGMILGWLRPRLNKVAGSDKPTEKTVPASTSKYEYITNIDFPAMTLGVNVPAVFGQGPREILADVVHWWGDPRNNPTFASTIAYLQGQAPSGVSSNWVVEAGKALCGVSEDNASHANGNAWANAKTVTWEANPRCSNGDYETLAEAMSDRWIARGYTTPGAIYGHNRYFATQCPGNYDLVRLKALVIQKFNAKRGIAGVVPNPTAPKPRPIQPPVVSPTPPQVPGNRGFVPDPHWRVDPGETLSHAAAWAGVTVEQIASFNNIKPPYVIVPGERIWPPKFGHDTYVVDPGNTISGIVAWYKSQGHKALTVEKVMNANGINNPATDLKVGMRLLIVP